MAGGAGGRPPKLTEVKVLEGTYRKDRVLPQAAEPILLASIPEPPEGLSPPAQVEWSVVATWLQEIGQLATTDLTLLAAYCNEIALYWAYDKKVKEKGAVIEFYDADDNLVRVTPNPYTALRTGALANAMRLAGQFGLTPVMRSRIQGNKPQKAKSKLELLKERRK